MFVLLKFGYDVSDNYSRKALYETDDCNFGSLYEIVAKGYVLEFHHHHRLFCLNITLIV